MDAFKNAEISLRILSKKAEGLSLPEAVDAVLGAGTYRRIADEVWEKARAKK